MRGELFRRRRGPRDVRRRRRPLRVLVVVFSQSALSRVIIVGHGCFAHSFRVNWNILFRIDIQLPSLIKALFSRTRNDMTTTIIQSEDFAKNDDDDDDSRRRRRSLLRRVQDVDLRNKIVLVRVDHNAVKDAQISDAFRDRKFHSTLYSIVERGGRPIVMTHVNRPRDKKTKTISMDEKDGTRAIAKYLTKKLGVVFANPKVNSSLSTTKKGDDDDDGGIEMSQIFKDDTMQTMIKDLKERRIGGIYLPNMRWFSGEERGTEEIGIRLARDLASIADVFVNDAFGSWQPHVSTFDVAKLLPSYAGLLMQRELDAMTRVLEPKRPFVAVVAGSKVNTKIGTLVNVAKKCDTLILGGMIYNAYLSQSMR